ncbi:MAG: hypothetical protein IKJ91_10575 [Clostridia bacterium]|nr:hypothetical protein [Clostridia bacterium]
MYTKQQVIELFKKVYADKNLLIFGEEMNNSPSMVSKTLERFKNNTGKYPGILGFDIRKSNLAKLGEEGIEQVVSEITDYAEKGGLVTCSAHLANPKNKNPDVDGYRGIIGGNETWLEMLTDGTELNKYFKMELSAIADFLEKLKKNKVPVIWRPLHEANGCWFWFCMVQWDEKTQYHRSINEETFIATWKYIYDYFNYERNLDNLLWEYSPNIVADDNKGMKRALYGYPGNMCDFVGMDWYSSGNYEIEKNSTYKDLASTGKPLAFAEWGPRGAIKANPEEGTKQPDIFSGEDLLALVRKLSSDGYTATYMLTWTSPLTLNEMTKGNIFMNANGILGLEDVAKMI